MLKAGKHCWTLQLKQTRTTENFFINTKIQLHYVLIALDYSVLNYIFAGVLLVYIGFRIMTPLRTNVHFFDKPVDDYAEGLYQNARNQNITLAAFSTAVLALLFSVDLPNTDADPSTRNENFDFGIIYISLATFFFIIASFTYILLRSRRFPYVGQTLEYTGLIALGIGFFHVIRVILSESDLLNVILLPAFVAGVLIIAGYELYLNFRFFYPKRRNVSRGQ
jgi:hypothetical protein